MTSKAIASDAIAKLLTFLPKIQAQSCDRATLQAFVNALYETHFVFRFDWPQWIAEADRYSQNPDLLAHAELLTLRKLMTVYISREHFAPGYLKQQLETDILPKMLQRLARLMDPAS